ncbi:MAG: FmdB family zinc ribbon protein [Planctomycetota bacterium]|jgi:putative FmdB family regulatory protein
MPYYDYMCNRCLEIWETKLPMGFKGLVTCPVCKTGETNRVTLQVPATVLNWMNPSSVDASGISRRFRGTAKSRRSRQRV